MTSKREFHRVSTATLGPSKNFSKAYHTMKLVFVSFLMIISIFQNKRGGRTMLRTDSKGANTSKWRFLKFHYHGYILPLSNVLKRRVLVRDDNDCRALQKLFCSFPWHEIFVCKLSYDHISLSKQMGLSYDGVNSYNPPQISEIFSPSSRILRFDQLGHNDVF